MDFRNYRKCKKHTYRCHLTCENTNAIHASGDEVTISDDDTLVMTPEDDEGSTLMERESARRVNLKDKKTRRMLKDLAEDNVEYSI